MTYRDNTHNAASLPDDYDGLVGVARVAAQPETSPLLRSVQRIHRIATDRSERAIHRVDDIADEAEWALKAAAESSQ